jgi:hypothetical protein
VKDLPFGVHVGLQPESDETIDDEHEAGTYPTAAEFVGQVSRVIAYCLAWAVLAHIIVAVFGTE